jgi:hypothetical protein
MLIAAGTPESEGKQIRDLTNSWNASNINNASNSKKRQQREKCYQRQNSKLQIMNFRGNSRKTFLKA